MPLGLLFITTHDLSTRIPGIIFIVAVSFCLSVVRCSINVEFIHLQDCPLFVL